MSETDPAEAGRWWWRQEDNNCRATGSRVLRRGTRNPHQAARTDTDKHNIHIFCQVLFHTATAGCWLERDPLRILLKAKFSPLGLCEDDIARVRFRGGEESDGESCGPGSEADPLAEVHTVL